jgi:WhiB family redox-sensing transcriptional regulator
VIQPPHPSVRYESRWDWQADAACRGVDTRLFFPPGGRRGNLHRSLEDAAKRLCSRCPVQLACRRYAQQAQEPYGVWGGLTEGERRAAAERAGRRQAG